MLKYDVVIVGAGPSGLTAARLLAENNKNVIVLEKNNVIGRKVCAEGTTKRTLHLIPREVIERKFNRYVGHSRFFTTTIKTKKPYVFTIDRKRLGEWMATKARRAGVEILLNHKVTEIKKDFVIANDKKFSFIYLIGADGSNSIVRKYLKLPFEIAKTLQYTLNKKSRDIEIFFKIYKKGYGYYWIFPNKNYTKIGVGTVGTNSKFVNLKKELKKFCEGRFNIKNAKLESFPINYCYKGHEFGNVFLAGDAAGFASEITGEGIYQAIISGGDIAKKIIDKNYDYEGIKELLDMKKRHRMMSKVLRFNRFLSSLILEICALALKNLRIARFFKNRFRIL